MLHSLWPHAHFRCGQIVVSRGASRGVIGLAQLYRGVQEIPRIENFSDCRVAQQVATSAQLRSEKLDRQLPPEAIPVKLLDQFIAQKAPPKMRKTLRDES